MLNKTGVMILGLVVCCILFLSGPVRGQDAAAFLRDDSGQPIRVPVPIGSFRFMQPTLADTIAWFLQATLKEMEREDVLVGLYANTPEGVRAEWPARDLLVKKNQTESYSEVLVVAEVSLLQEQVVEAGQEYFDGVRQKQGQEKPVSRVISISTDIAVRIDYLDPGTGQLLGTSSVHAVHSDGSIKKSEDKAFDALSHQLRLEMARVYGLSRDVVFDGSALRLRQGFDEGLPRKQIFALIAPEQRHHDRERTLWRGSSLAGFAVLADARKDTCSLRVSRQWRELDPGSWAMPYFQPVFSFYLHVLPPIFTPYAQYGLYLQGNPLDQMDWGLGLNVIRVKDSFDDQDYGLGISAFGCYRLRDGGRLDLALKLGGDMDIPFRRDDAGNSVSALLLSMQSAVTADLLLSYRTNLVFSAGYRRSLKADSWDYSEEDESYPARWNGAAPSVSNSGFFITAGFKYSLFEFVF